MLNHLGQDAHDVGVARVELFNFVRGDVEAGDGKLLATEEECQRKPHIAHADDADARLAGFDALF